MVYLASVYLKKTTISVRDKVDYLSSNSVSQRVLRDISWSSMVMLGAVVFLKLLFNENKSYIIPYALGVLGCIISLYYSRREELCRIIGEVAAVLGVIVLGGTVLFLDAYTHFTTPLWMITHACIIFAVVGYRWGRVVLGSHFLILVIYYFTYYDSTLYNPSKFYFSDTILMVEVCICFLGMGYILTTSFKTSKEVKRKMKEQQVFLEEQVLLISEKDKQKEILLQEVHHRVKNNLQLISSLLNLQNQNIEGGSVYFEDSIDRIKALAFIHEEYYSKEGRGDFCLKAYLESFIGVSIKNTTSNFNQVRYDILGEGVSLTQESITPIALFFNELIIGSVRRKKEDGLLVIEIVIKIIDEKKYEVSYSDNAIWSEDTLNPTGLMIVESTVEQLDGKITQRIINENGLKGKVIFPLPKERFSVEK